MTSLADARGELVTALEADGVPVGAQALPTVRIFLGGATTDHLVRGQVPATFRLVIIGGSYGDGDGASIALATAAGTVLGTLRDLEGWTVGDLGPERVARHAGGDVLVAELSAVRMTDL